jgi:ribosomal protein L11 methyltransferase
VLIAEKVRVRPSWEPATDDGVMDIVVDPGQAFGTGAHPTTRLVLELLLALADRGRAEGPIADWGTGSGVLAIAAAKLGWDPVTGCDREDASLETAQANAKANGIELALDRIDVREQAPPLAPTVVANLTGNLLGDCAAQLGRTGDGPETLICSGMLESEIDQVREAFVPLGLGEARRTTEHEWGALLLRREPEA